MSERHEIQVATEHKGGDQGTLELTKYGEALHAVVWGTQPETRVQPVVLTERELKPLQELALLLFHSDHPRGIGFLDAFLFAEANDVVNNDPDAFHQRLKGLDQDNFNPDGSRKQPEVAQAA